MSWRRSSFCWSGECVEAKCSAGARFKKAKRSFSNGDCVEVACSDGATWTKAKRSFCNSNCVEVARHGGVLVRDSKNPDGPHLHFTQDEWRDFISQVKAAA